MREIRVLIVDDERPARNRIRRHLDDCPAVEIAGEAGDGREAVQAIERERPDLVFLDVQMPGLDGFGVIQELDFQPLPQIVFVTAHDQFALRAFEVHALDYLLKPFEADRFKAVLDRARSYIERSEQDSLNDRMTRLIEELCGSPRFIDRLFINLKERAFFLQIDRLDWVEGARNYVRVHAGNDSYVVRGTIEGLQRKLNPARFIRINRSQIVNLDRIKELQPLFHGEYRVILRDGTEMTWSRRYLDRSSELFTSISDRQR